MSGNETIRFGLVKEAPLIARLCKPHMFKLPRGPFVTPGTLNKAPVSRVMRVQPAPLWPSPGPSALHWRVPARPYRAVRTLIQLPRFQCRITQHSRRNRCGKPSASGDKRTASDQPSVRKGH
jgi:hypothetical protein